MTSVSNTRLRLLDTGLPVGVAVAAVALCAILQPLVGGLAAALLEGVVLAAATAFAVRRLALAPLVELDRRYHALVAATDAVVWTGGDDGSFRATPESWTRYTGQGAAEAAGDGWRRCIHPDDAATEETRWRAAVADDRAYQYEYRLWHAATGTWRWNRECGVPLPGERRSGRRWIGVYIDIDDLRNTEQALRDSEALYRTFVEQSQDGIWRLAFDPPVPLDAPPEEQFRRYLQDGRVVECNDAFARSYGFERSRDMHGRTNLEMLPETVPENVDFVREMVAGGYRVASFETLEPDRDGNLQVMRGTISGIVRDGLLVGEWGIHRNITGERETRDELDRQRRLLETVFDLAPVAITVKDESRRFRYVNRAELELLGWSREQVIGRSLADMDGALVSRMREMDDRVFADGAVFRNRPDVLTDASGSEHAVLVSKAPLRDADGRVTGVVTCSTDVTDLERARHELARSEQRWRQVFDASPIAMELFDGEGRYIEGNPASIALFGEPDPDLPQVNVINSEQVLLSPPEIERLMAGEVVAWEDWYDFRTLADRGVDTRGRTGRLYLNVLHAPLLEPGRPPHGFLVVTTDHTEAKRTATALAEGEARYRRFVDNSHEAIWRIEFDPPIPTDRPAEEQVRLYFERARIAECNDAMARQYGYQRAAELIGRPAADVLSEDAAEHDFLRRFILEGYRVRDGHAVDRHRDGSPVHLRVNAVGEVMDGALVREWGIAQDVTAGVQAEQARAEQRALLEAIVDTVPIGITVKDRAGRITFANRWMADVWGTQPAAMIGRTLREIGLLPDVDDIDALDRQVLDTGERIRDYRTHLVHAVDGGRIEIAEHKSPLRDADGRVTGVLTALQDITAQEAAATALDHERALLQTILDTAPVSITVKDEEARYTYINRRAREVSRWGDRDVIGLTAADIDPIAYSSDVLDLDRRVLSTGEPSFDVVVGGRDERSGELVCLMLNKSPLRDAAGRVTGLVSMTMDVSAQKRAESELAEQRSLFASVLNALPVGISVKDRDTRYRYVNRWWIDQSGFTEDVVIGRRVSDLAFETDAQTMDELDRRVLDTGASIRDIESPLVSVQGDARTCLVTKVPLIGAEGGVDGIITSVVDITDRKQFEAALAEGEHRYRALYDDNPSMFFTIGEDGVLRQVNRFGASALGYAVEELVGRPMADLHADEDRELVAGFLKRCLDEPEVTHRWEVRRRLRDGDTMWVRETARVVQDSDGRPVVLTVCEDISEARSLSEELSYQASHDPLTGLMNRREFERRLAQAMEALREGDEHALCYFDLDQFKVINDTCGHVAGDELLRQLAALFHGQVRRHDVLARLGGDEFGLLMTDCDLAAGRRVCGLLRDALEEYRFFWEGKTFRVGTSIGMVAVDVASGGVGEVLGDADAACYAAKEQGRNRIHVYRRDDEDLARRRGEMQWVARLERALAEDRFRLVYQEIVPLAGASEGHHYELLLRMHDEEDRVVSPGDFLPAVERYGLAPRVDRFVLERAAEWLGSRPAHLRDLYLCSINLSGLSLSSEGFAAFVVETFARHAVPLANICFEITETAAIANLAHATRFIDELHAEGCRFALDDFGSGLSSFAYLKNLPVDFLKIDGMFVKDIAEDPIDRAMVRSINEIGHVMRKRTIAEFVESASVLERLRELGVDYGQGYHIGKPKPLDTLG